MAAPPGKPKRPTGKVPVRKPGAAAPSTAGPKKKLKRPPGAGVVPEEQKPKAKAVEMNRDSIIMASIAGVLAIASLVLIVQSGFRLVRRWHFREGLLQHDMGRPAGAMDSLKSAVNWDSDNPEPKLLLAKVYVEDDMWTEADELYSDVINSEFGGQHPEAHVGMGVMYLRQADKAKTPEATGEFLTKAEAAFAKAGGATEAKIGLAVAKLIRDVKIDGGTGAGAAGAFAEAYTKAKADAPTLDACIDLYSGMALAGYSSEAYGPLGSDAARAWLQYDPSNIQAMSAVLVYDGQFLEHGHAKADTPEALAAIVEAQNLRAGQFIVNRLKEKHGEENDRLAAVAFLMSVFYWRVEQGLWAEAQQVIRKSLLQKEILDLPGPIQADVYYVQKICEVPSFAQRNQYLGNADMELAQKARKLEGDENFNKQYPKLLTQTYAAIAQAKYMISHNGGDKKLFKQAADYLKKAVEREPGEYVHLRNLALALYRANFGDEAKSHLEKLRELAGEDPARQQDVDDIGKVLNQE